MSLTFRCGECGHLYTVPEELAGKWVRCKHCESTLEVPSPKPSQATPQRQAPTPQNPPKQARPLSALPSGRFAPRSHSLA